MTRDEREQAKIMLVSPVCRRDRLTPTALKGNKTAKAKETAHTKDIAVMYSDLEQPKVLEILRGGD